MLLKNRYPIILSTLIFVFSLVLLFSGRSEFIFYANVSTPSDLKIKIEKKEYLFKSKRVKSIRLEKSNTYNFETVDYEKIKSISFDLKSKKDSKLRIYYALIKKPGFEPIYFNLNNVEFNENSKILELSNTLLVQGNNKLFTLKTSESLFNKLDYRSIFVLFVFALVLFFILKITDFNFFNQILFNARSLIVPFALLIIFCMALNMAVLSRYNGSPDENDHFLAVEYFKNNSKTPKKGTSEAVFSYNPSWNYSRVYNKELDYMLSGRFTSLFKGMSIENYKSARFFNVSLILLLFIVSILFPKYNIILIPFILTPQSWYIMSYVNNGALPLFLSFLLLIITEKNKRIFSDKFDNKNNVLFLMAIILGVILLSKRNYLIFAFSYVMYIFFLSNVNLTQFKLNGIKLYKPLLLVITVAIAVFGLRVGAIKILNKTTPALTENVEEFYKKSQENRDKLFKNGRGGEAMFGSYLISTKKWIKASYNSFNGNYGYMQYESSERHYNKLLVVHIFVLIILAYFFRKNYSIELLAYLCIFLVVGGLLFFASSYLYSYKYDYQPQGKYLLPILPVLGMLIYKCKVDTKILMLVGIVLFSFSAYSFVFKGILNLQ